MNHQETYDKITEAMEDLREMMWELIKFPKLYEKAEHINKSLQIICNSEYMHTLNDIQNNPTR